MSWFDDLKDTVSDTASSLTDKAGEGVTGWWENEVSEWIGESSEGPVENANPSATVTQPTMRDRTYDENTSAVGPTMPNRMQGMGGIPTAWLIGGGVGLALVLALLLR